MVVFESQKVRRVLGRLERGESVPEAFRRLARDKGIAAGWVSALGAFEWVELMEYDQATKKYKEPRRVAECEILNLTGNISFRNGESFVHLHATVSKEKRSTIEVLGGHLVDASVFACEFAVECFEDVMLERSYDDATGLDLWTGGERTTSADLEERMTNPPPAGRESGELSWAQVAAAAQAVSASEPPSRKEQMPQPGDYLEHKNFGVCRVEGRGTDGALIIRLPNDPRRKKISVETFSFVGPKQDGDKRVFVLRKR